jgi:Uma2 family endonuclease
VPDFVIELRSKSDSLETLQAKLQEYIDNGVRLGWLIDRQQRQAFVYREDGSVTRYPGSATLEGEAVAPEKFAEKGFYGLDARSRIPYV